MNVLVLFLLTGALIVGTVLITAVLVRRDASRRRVVVPELDVSPVPRTVSEATAEAAASPPGDRRDEPRDDGRQDSGETKTERADRLRNLLLSRMSHDLRSPLNSVIALSQLLSEGSAGALSLEQRRYVEVIHRSGQTLLALVNDILDLSAVESGRLELEVGPVDLAAVVSSVADSCGRAARDKGIPLRVALPSQSASELPLLVRSDEQRLRQVVEHLVDHAISETRNGYVELTASVDPMNPERAAVRIHDTGEGLSEPARRALTEATRELDGAILGEGDVGEPPPVSLPLLLASRLAKLMGLPIAVQSSAADGVSFELSLPTASPEEVIAERPAGVTAPPTARRATGHVLLIEDDRFERGRVAGLIETLGYDVTMASSGEEGLSLMRDGHFDVVVLDLVMPGMSGLDVLRAARADARLGEVPFVVLSALYMTKSERAVLGPKVADVVRKGATTAEELEAALHRTLSGAAGRAEADPSSPSPPAK